MIELNSLEYDHNYYFYKSYINNKNEIIYEIISEDQLYLLNELSCKIIIINKNIPKYFHKIFLHCYYLQYYCICCK
jgi:hypothetical protein